MLPVVVRIQYYSNIQRSHIVSFLERIYRNKLRGDNMEFHNIFNNVDITILIYKSLNIGDQFVLSKVSSGLRDVFEKYIFPNNYSTLTVSGNLDYFVVKNETNRNRIVLNPKELNEFLSYNANRMQIFEQINSSVIDVRPFQHLTSLCYGFMQISRLHLELLSDLEKYCPKLEKIRVDCCIDEQGRDIMVGLNWSVKSLLAMKNLKSLQANIPRDPSGWVPLKFQDFYELATKENLEYLMLRCIVQPPKIIMESKKRSALKELNIGFKFQASTNLISYFQIFENLTFLTITLRPREGKITDRILEQIAEACPKLESLSFLWTYFNNVTSFIMPQRVTELTLYQCVSLTTDNLRQILTHSNLRKFSSWSCYYMGEVRDFTLSPSLEKLVFERNRPNNLQLAFGGSEKLKYLTWHNTREYEGNLHSSADNTALLKCINLEELDLNSGGFIKLDILAQLKTLHKLAINPSVISNMWLYITTLLRDSNIGEFDMSKNWTNWNCEMNTDIPIIGFHTNTRIIRINLEVFTSAMDFWLDLFNLNDALQLEVFQFRPESEFMRTLINHAKFPVDLDMLDICCFNIKCQDLRGNLESTLEKLQRDIGHLKYENNDNLYRIIFFQNGKYI